MAQASTTGIRMAALKVAVMPSERPQDAPPRIRPAPGDSFPVDDLGPESPALSRILDGLRVGTILGAVAVVTAIGLPLQWLALKLRLPAARTIPLIFHRTVLRLIGVRVSLKGEPSPSRPLLILSNHVSWLDICVVGSLTPLVFVAKSEVAGWPLIGLLARFQRTVFVDRRRRHATGAVNREIAERLKAGDPVVLFAEGTSSDGNRVLPFRTALVGAVREAFDGGADVTVQPLSVAYVRLQGVPSGRQHRPQVAWYGDMDLAPHLLEVVRQGAVDVEVTFGPGLAIDADHDRKAVTGEAEELVRAAFVASLSGRTG